MSTLPPTPTNPIYQDGPLAQAITAFQQQIEQSYIAYEESKRETDAHEATRLEEIINKAKQRFGDIWPILSPYIVKSRLDYGQEATITIAMPQITQFELVQHIDGYAKIYFPYSRLDVVTFNARNSPISVGFGKVLVCGHQHWLEKEAERQAEEEQKAKKLAYTQAWRDYEREYASILSKNETALALLQEQYTTTFPVWRLTYGITSHSDDDGEFYADTRSVWVLSPDPDEDGFFPVIDDTGYASHRKYYSLVYLDGPQTFQVDHGSTHCGHLHIKEANDSLYFSPLLNYAEVLTRARGWVEANMHPLPDLPTHTAFGLDERPDRWEIEELEKELSGEGGDEIPF
ncbi:MAG: hypothetical protein KJ063_02585 [Anaerolineae bacterium]|nr:hypothetical protein [Anaerolineae bacterium]